MNEVKTGTVVETVQSANSSKELSGGAQAGIGIAIGAGNLCCGPFCYSCPTMISTAVGIILYAVWQKEKPKTAKNILTVTLVTAGVALIGFGILFAIGIAGSVLDSATHY